LFELPHTALLLSRKEVELVLSPKDVVDAVEDAYREMGSKTATGHMRFLTTVGK
jgi:hypothetical protein